MHTTWLLNFEYVKKSPQGELASKFLEASAFFAPNEIQEELINCELLSTDKTSNILLMKNQIVEVLTKFSLFQRKSNRTQVQEVIRNKMTFQETATSMRSAVKLLYQAFRNCPSPDEVLVYVSSSDQEQPSAFLTNQSLFYLWSRLTTHSSELQQHLKTLLYEENIGREIKEVALTSETSRVVYENAIQLSVHGHQAEAKEAERLAFRIFDSCPGTDGRISKEDVTKLFPHVLPLPQVIQKTVLYSSRRPVECPRLSRHVTEQSHFADEPLRLRGNTLYKEGCYKEAVEVYSEALEAYDEGKQPDPRLLNNRATAYLKLRNFQQCLQDSEEYIKILPTCWKGYTRKALALKGLGLHFPAICSAAIAYYHDASSCRHFKPFVNVFKDLDGKWEVVDSSGSLQRCLKFNNKCRWERRVLLLRNRQYNLTDFQIITNTTLAALEKS